MTHRPISVVALLIAVAACGSSGSTPSTEPPTTTTPPSTGAPALTSTTTDREVLTVETKEGIPIDIHFPTAPGPLPVALLLHGSPPNTKEDVSVFADLVARETGTLVYNVGWTEGGLDGVDGSVENVACAVAFARDTAELYEGDARRITVVGFSAGGWSGATVALGGSTLGTNCESNSNSLPDAFVGIAGAYSAAIDGPVAGLLATDPEALRASDPYTYLGENPTLKLWLVHGDVDTEVPLSESQGFRDALVANGYMVELVVLADTGHPGDSPLSPDNEEKVLTAIRSATGGG